MGVWHAYYPYGHLEEKGKFFRDMKVGRWQYYNELGGLLKKRSTTNEALRFMKKFTDNCLFIISLALIFFACKNQTESKTGQGGVDTLNTVAPGYQNFVEYYNNGQKRIEGKMVNGKREGIWRSFYENGALWSTGFYVNGKRQGIGIVFYSNGKKYIEGEYKDDRRTGKWTFFNEKGEVIKEVNYN